MKPMNTEEKQIFWKKIQERQRECERNAKKWLMTDIDLRPVRSIDLKDFKSKNDRN